MSVADNMIHCNRMSEFISLSRYKVSSSPSMSKRTFYDFATAERDAGKLLLSWDDQAKNFRLYSMRMYSLSQFLLESSMKIQMYDFKQASSLIIEIVMRLTSFFLECRSEQKYPRLAYEKSFIVYNTFLCILNFQRYFGIGIYNIVNNNSTYDNTYLPIATENEKSQHVLSSTDESIKLLEEVTNICLLAMCKRIFIDKLDIHSGPTEWMDNMHRILHTFLLQIDHLPSCIIRFFTPHVLTDLVSILYDLLLIKGIRSSVVDRYVAKFCFAIVQKNTKFCAEQKAMLHKKWIMYQTLIKALVSSQCGNIAKKVDSDDQIVGSIIPPLHFD